MSPFRRRTPFRRLKDGRIGLDLPPGVREFMVAAAERLRDIGATPGTAGHARLFGRIDESAEVDDPAYAFARHLALDELASTVTASADKSLIDAGEAEAWLKVLGLTLARRSAELGIRTEEDRAGLGDEDEAVVRVAYALQIGLMDALDEPEEE